MYPILRNLDALVRGQAKPLETLSADAGYEKRSISRWLNGESRMPVEALVDVANTCGYEVILVPKTVLKG